MDFCLPFRTMAYNNAWANHRFLKACTTLSQIEFQAVRTSFFPSLQETLNHIYTVDLFYIDAMEGGSLGYDAFEDPRPFLTPSSLFEAQVKLDKRLIVYTEDLNAQTLATIVSVHRGNRTQRERADRLLLHVFQHQIHHRGQAHAMLSGTAVIPPQLDEFFSISEAPLRATEFAELGFSESEIWKNRD
jgi:uncharacterized damage-inducible protein DinB